MGQAKLRGDFETRKKEGIERRERERLARVAELEARIVDRDARRAALIAGIAGILAGTTPELNYPLHNFSANTRHSGA